MLVNIHFSKYHIWEPLAPVHARVSGAKTLRSVAAFLRKLGTMKLLRSERPGISFFAKVVQLLALKCGTGLMFPEKIVVFIAQSGLKLYDFNIVDGELKRTQNVVVPGSEAADGMWQKTC